MQRWLKRSLWSFGLVLLHWLGRALMLQLAASHFTMGLAQALRVGLTAVAAPATAIEGVLWIHTGVGLPHHAVLFLVFLVYVSLADVVRTAPAESGGARLTRRAFLASGGATLAVAAYGAGYEREHLTFSHRDLPLRDLPPSLEGRRLVLLSDLHRGPLVSMDYLHEVIKKVNALQPDLVLLPGDFISKSPDYYPDVAEILAGLRPRIASLATLGNHDHWEGAELARQAITEAGVLLLDNSNIYLDARAELTVEAARGLCLAGVDDLWEGKPDLALALRGVAPEVPRILLSHNPDLAEEEGASGLRVDLQVSGHTHGGQIVLPGLGPVATGSRYGLKYVAGAVNGPGWPVYVTRGIGTSMLPARLGSPPEIVVFDLRSSRLV
ncbi:MAG: metallophosphoesterase [Candidatus Eremiobacteraeota bacterium]|nr:metallophosphoesterase [Candidatus Eremiobacteraeota bacterium]